jgi:hypothetical protein
MDAPTRRQQADLHRYIRIVGEQLDRQNEILTRQNEILEVIAKNLNNSEEGVAFGNPSSYYLNQRLPDGEDGV